MTHGFDKDYWESHWRQAAGHGAESEIEANPYLARELGRLSPGTAFDAGCGEGAEARWLASIGWQVTAADISVAALARATKEGVAAERVRWVEADLSVWESDEQFDLVTTHYAHPAIPQLAFYQRISGWVAPRGTLLIVGHRHPSGQHDHAQNSPDEASVSAASITAVFDSAEWEIVTAEEPHRALTNRAGQAVELDDVVVRAIRRH
jgi:SAM-dependent methyltransferase